MGFDDTAPSLVDTKVEGKTGKKNKKHKNRQSAACQMKAGGQYTEVTVEEQSPSSQNVSERLEKRSAGSKQNKKTRKTRNQSFSPVTSPASSSHLQKAKSAQKPSALPVTNQLRRSHPNSHLSKCSQHKPLRSREYTHHQQNPRPPRQYGVVFP